MAFLSVLLVLALSGAPDLSGTWKLELRQSRIANEVGWPGLIGAGAPDRIHLTQAANGTLVTESEINESHARIYEPGGRTVTPVAQTGSITMSSRWEGRRLLAEGVVVSPSGVSSAARETLTLSEDGLVLSVEISTAEGASTLTYVRTEGVDPCDKWPTPCKTPGSAR